MRRLSGAVLGALVLIGGACTGGDESTSSPSASPTAVASPSPTPLPKLPLSEARLAGKFNVKHYVTANTFDSMPLQRQVFRFVPRCDEGACDASVVGAMAFGQGLEDRQSAGADTRFNIRLAGLGRSYRARRLATGHHATTNLTRIVGPLPSRSTRRSTSMTHGWSSAGLGRGHEAPSSPVRVSLAT